MGEQKKHHASREIIVPYYLNCELSRVLHSKEVKREKLNLKSINDAPIFRSCIQVFLVSWSLQEEE